MLFLMIMIFIVAFMATDLYSSYASGEELLVSHYYKKIKGVTNSKAITSNVDEEGYPLKYDPHYARKIEVEQGLKGQLTQCDNSNCKTCYWKADRKSITQLNPKIQKLYDDWLDGLPDGLSDELYELMWDDFASSEELIRLREEIENNLLENYYGTPADLVLEYQEKGYTFDKHRNSWYPPVKVIEPKFIGDTSPYNAQADDIWLDTSDWPNRFHVEKNDYSYEEYVHYED